MWKITALDDNYNCQMHLRQVTCRLHHFFKFKKQQCAHARRCSDGCVNSWHTVLCGRQRVRFALCFDQDLVVSPWFFTSSSGFWFHSRIILHLPFKLSSCSCVTIQQTSPLVIHQPSFQVCVFQVDFCLSESVICKQWLKMIHNFCYFF